MSEESKSKKCEDCRGTGKYVGLWIAHEDCRTCGGTGFISLASEEDQRHDNSLLPHCRAPSAQEKPEVKKTPAVVRTNVDLRKTWSKMFNGPAATP